MSFSATPLFPGDLHDTSLRLAAVAKTNSAASAQSNIPSDAWRQMLTLGWQGVLVPEAAGGVDGQPTDLAEIIEAAARHAIAVPLIDRCAVAPVLLSPLADQPVVRDLLEALTLGEASVATVLDARERMPSNASGLRLSAGNVLRGTLKGVDLTEPASHVAFNVIDEATLEPTLLLLPIEQLQAHARYFEGMDGRVTADFSLEGQAVQASQILARGSAVLDAVEGAQKFGSLFTCVQTVGAAGAMIEQTIEYLNTRMQFGVHLSTFQALRHRAVEMYVAYENAAGMVRPLVTQATREDPGEAGAISLSKLCVGDASRTWSESAIQLHGGMGMTCETLAARLAVHTLMGSLQYGDQAQCLDWLTARSMADAVAA
ncbi:acyl-CoA dehydrogenase [Ottowia thiooxydans]|uniref:acyl-CoA dehydrogenase n=1 Tax=Ottowia thiooxydans TaxID=219182 RepID=UPI000410B722|nr:acyl-CoA dehydrogenase [Ottowia thiooxydans]